MMYLNDVTCNGEAVCLTTDHMPLLAAVRSLAQFQRPGARRSVKLRSRSAASHRVPLPPGESWDSRCTTACRALVSLYRGLGTPACGYCSQHRIRPTGARGGLSSHPTSNGRRDRALRCFHAAGQQSWRHNSTCHCLRHRGCNPPTGTNLSHTIGPVPLGTTAEPTVLPVRDHQARRPRPG